MIANRNAMGSAPSGKVHDNCRACWTTHGALGSGVHPHVHTAAFQFDEEVDWSRSSHIVSTVKKSTVKC
jgi:hypothetical protein